MPQAYPSPEDPSDTGTASVWIGLIMWLIALGAAVVVYLLTGNPLYAAAIPYFQAVAKPLGCGLWLWSVDPDPARGRAYLWFYLALAFWMAALSAFVSFLVFLFTDLRMGQQPPMDLLALTMTTLFFGALIGSMTGAVAIVLAFRGNIRIWLHPNLRIRCGGDFHRLPQANLGYNFAFSLVTFSLILPTILIGAWIMAWNPTNVGPNDASLFSLIVVLLFFLIGPFVMLAASVILCSRIAGLAPSECWE